MGVDRDIAGIDIWRSAKLLVDQHGADAPIRAAQHADELLAVVFVNVISAESV